MADKNTLDNLTGQEIKELINDEVITLEELDTSALEILMNYETDMLCYGKGDIGLISKCSDLLDKIEGPVISEEEFISIIERTKAEYVTIIPERSVNNKPAKTRVVIKRTLLVAAAILLLITSTVGIASALGFDVFNCIANIVRQPEGAEENINEFTFYHNGETKKYSSIEEMIDSENLDIMYPTKLPDGVSIANIRAYRNVNDNECIKIFTDNTDISITIELSSMPTDSNNANTYEYNGVLYYIDERDTFCATCYVYGNKYYITANSREDLTLIIKNME